MPEERAVELLGLHDRLDALDEELRVQKIALVLTPLVSTLLAVPLFAVLFVNEARFFIAYPSVFVILLGAILAALTVERRRFRREQNEIRRQLRHAEADSSRTRLRGPHTMKASYQHADTDTMLRVVLEPGELREVSDAS